MIAGVSDELRGNGAACGRRYRVQCIGGANEVPHPCRSGASVEVTIVDYCRPPCNGVLNVYRDAFAQIADLDAGKVRVEYNQI
ncbi:hypothetical protein QYF36_000923 [Acer negundo]|nr:hypothetical protein QYF36_000923 [Acer negundo]